MAKFSQQFLANLGRPQMAESLFGLGTAIGSLPGQAKAKAKQEQFNKIMDLANRAIVTNDPVNLGRARRQLQELGFTEEANKLAAAQMQAEQKQATTSLFQTALSQPTGLTPQQQAEGISKGISPEQVLAASELGKATGDPARSRGRARLRALAMNPQFDPTDPKQLEGYKGIARATRVNPEEAMEILSKERGTMVERAKLTSTRAGSGDFGFAEGETWVDKNNNYYSQGTRRNKQTGKYETVFDPITPGAPDIPVGPLTPVMPGTMETSAERLGRVGKEAEIKAGVDILKADTIAENENFSDVRMKASARLPQVEGTLSDVNELLEIIERVDQGGSLAGLQNRISRVLGREAKDEGDLRTRAKELLVGRIKAFGANPTEGERQYLEQLIPDLENSRGVNKVILERLQQRLQRERASIGYLFSEGANLDGYIGFVNAQYATDTSSDTQPTDNKVVDFNEIQ